MKGKLLLGIILLLCLAAGPAWAAPAAVRLDTLSNLSLRVPPAGRWVHNYALAANTAKTITVPDWANYVNISGAAIWVNWTGAQAAVPSGDVTDGTGAVLNTGVRFIGPMSDVQATSGPVSNFPAITSFVVISATAQEISVECWK